jgi:hypothetical protein
LPHLLDSITNPDVRLSASGLPDFYWYNIPKWGILYQITIIYTKWPQNIPNGHYVYTPTSSIPRPSIIYPNWDFFVLKICHLAALVCILNSSYNRKISKFRGSKYSTVELQKSFCNSKKWQSEIKAENEPVGYFRRKLRNRP